MTATAPVRAKYSVFFLPTYSHTVAIQLLLQQMVPPLLTFTTILQINTVNVRPKRNGLILQRLRFQDRKCESLTLTPQQRISTATNTLAVRADDLLEPTIGMA